MSETGQRIRGIAERLAAELDTHDMCEGLVALADVTAATLCSARPEDRKALLHTFSETVESNLADLVEAGQ